MGIPVHIANGRTKDVILRIMQEDGIGTRFPAKKVTSNFKKYMAHAYEEPKGKVVINQGAKEVLLSLEKAHSLLPVGITRVIGNFKKGDIIRIVDERDSEVGLGPGPIWTQKSKRSFGVKEPTGLDPL